jgi:hypothetical protein
MFVNVTQITPLGEHFAAWSIMWLGGQESYYSAEGNWTDLSPDVMVNHTMHGFDLPVPEDKDVAGLMTEHKDRRVLMIGSGYGPGKTRPSSYDSALAYFEQRLDHLKSLGWKTVLLNDPQDATMAYGGLSNLRNREDKQVNDVSKRNEIITQEMKKRYTGELDIQRACLHYVNQGIKLKKLINDSMERFLSRDEVHSLTVNELIQGDITVFESLLSSLGLRLDRSRCEQWKSRQREWAEANRSTLTWRHLLPQWCDAISDGRDLDMPHLDHIQLAVLQIHLARNYHCRLRNMESRANARDYHRNLHITQG